MGLGHGIRVLVGVVSPFLMVVLLFFAMYHCRNRSLFFSERDQKGASRRCRKKGELSGSNNNSSGGGGFEYNATAEAEAEELISFPGGEDLTVHGILDAPGEVVGKSSYGTLYKATLSVGGGGPGGWSTLMLLRFVRPARIGRTREILPAVQLLGFVRHPNLLPLRALYVGPRGEKLLVHPFLSAGNLCQFLRDDGNTDSHKWEVIHKLSVGIAKGLNHLHNGLPRPVIHGNLKSKNILLDADYQPRLSDYSLHLLLNPTTGQEMLEVSAAEGYKAPELIKMKDAGKECDIYSLGVILLEILTRKEPVSSDLSTSPDLHLPNSVRNLVPNHKISEVHSAELLSLSEKQNSITEEGLRLYFQLAMACCCPSPSLRPNIKHVLGKLEEIGQ